jgi:ABC-2 type transport system permease protein
MMAVFRRDFRSYFTGMLGYVFLAAFLIIMNIFFSMYNIIYASNSVVNLFSVMLLVIMFTVPILTMRTFSEDLKQKTDQLLFTSPVKLWSVVIGKFLAAFGVFVLGLIFTLLWVLLIWIFGTPNVAETVGNYIGILCVSALFVSIGMFISSLTENQLIAAVGSYGVFFVLYILDMVVQGTGSGLPAWLIRFFSFISIFTRFGTISTGLLSLDDIVFFISFTALFLFLCYRVLEKKRWS